MQRWSSLLLNALLLQMLVVCSLAQAVPSIEEYGKLPEISRIELSPSGKLIAFRKNVDGKDYFIVFSLADWKKIAAIDITERNPRKIEFIDDNNVLLVVSDELRIGGFVGVNTISTAYRLELDSGNIDQLLTLGNKIFPAQGGLGRVVGYSEDRSHIYMTAYVGERTTEKPPYSVMKVNIKKPNRLKEVFQGKNWSTDFFLGKDGQVLAEERYNDQKNIHQLLVPNGRVRNAIFEKETKFVHETFIGLTPDYKSIVVLREDKASSEWGYFLMSLADGKVTPTSITRTDKSVEQAFVDDNRIVRGVMYSGLTPSYYFFDKQLNSFVQQLVAKFPQHSVWISSYSADWQKLVIRVEGSQSSGNYYVVEQGKDPQLIAYSRPGVKADDVNPIATFAFSGADGLQIPTLLTIPKDNVGKMKNLPLVVYPHGGPKSYDHIGFDFLAQVFASRGYLVAQPQFRGSDGFGADFVRAGWGEWGKKMQSDVDDVVGVLVKKGMVDPARVCIVGWSYGGYAALAGGAFNPDLYKCVVSINGVSDLPKMDSMEVHESGELSSTVDYWRRSWGVSTDKKINLKSISPAYYADNFKAPVLLIHGDKDKVVSIHQSKAMYSRLKEAGKQVELKIADGDNHNLIVGENRVEMVKSVVKFLDQNIGK
ncbi:alpha/beta hydrolase family protein [Teredinibacter turnerae]|uniref:alpha/beta hydrolase family protein n=1 Tax=Teredinibacter turnerae TaxID=2426 RepID=UPI0030CADF4F